jgi:hypothetical protein
LKVQHDMLVSPVGHAHGIFGGGESPPPNKAGAISESELEGQIARIYFILDKAKMLPRVLVSALAVAAIFGLLLLIPGAVQSLNDQEDSATALFLFIPALLVALNARSQENFITAKALITLRVVAVVLAALLVIAGGLVVLAPKADGAGTTTPGQAAIDVATTSFWTFSFFMSAALAIILLSGYLNLAIRGRNFHEDAA